MAGLLIWISTEFMELFNGAHTDLSIWLTLLFKPGLIIGFWMLHKFQSPEKNTISLIATILIIQNYVVFFFADFLLFKADFNSVQDLMMTYPLLKIPAFLHVAGVILLAWTIIKIRKLPVWTGVILGIMSPLGAAIFLFNLPMMVFNVTVIVFCLVIFYQLRFVLYQETKHPTFSNL